jgi:hypothetical protein
MKWIAFAFGLAGGAALGLAFDGCSRDYVNELGMVGAALVFMSGTVFGAAARSPVKL